MIPDVVMNRLLDLGTAGVALWDATAVAYWNATTALWLRQTPPAPEELALPPGWAHPAFNVWAALEAAPVGPIEKTV